VRPSPRRSTLRRATWLTLVLLSGVGFLPLFGGPGYEAALAAGVLLPALSAVATAFDVRHREPFAAFSRGVVSGAWLAAVGLAIAWLHGFRVGFCDPVEGAELYLLGPFAGAVMGGVWGAAVGVWSSARAARRGVPGSRALVVVAALAAPVVGVVVSFLRFYTSPMVFAFDPFFGFFAGTLYDSVITGMGRLVTYRAGSLATLIATGAFAFALERQDSGVLLLAWRRRPGATALAVVGAFSSILHAARGASLGHYQTAATIREALGKSLVMNRCELVYPAGTPEVEARALVRECDGHVKQLERFFGTRGPDRITAFVFASADQKGYLMGAAGTYIAKPWRREIYIQRSGFPHPVMRHELAHVMAGAFGQGPFRVAGPLGGIVPDPGRIEGVAVAAAPHDEELSPAEWARAMKTLGLLPPLDRVFKLSFLGEPSSRAYVVAGAFIDWLRREHGIEAVRRWYSGGSLESAAGASLTELERAWSHSLDLLVVGPDVLEVARARFDQPAIFGRRCPHVVDRIAGEAGGALAQLDTERARKLYGDLLRLDPHDFGARLGLSTCALREGKLDAARALLEATTQDPALGKAVRARAVETLGDLALQTKAGHEARERYDEVARLVVDQDRLRTLDVKRYAAEERDRRRAIVDYLLGAPEAGRDAAEASANLGAWAEREPGLGMADYLLSRTYLGEGRFDLSSRALERAIGKELPIPSVVREAYRLRVVLACALGEDERVRSAYAGWSVLPGPRPPERREMADLVERCTGKRPDTEVPTLSPMPAPPTPVPASSPSSSATPAAPCPEDMALIPAAEIWIGSPRGQGADDEWPRYKTRLAAFCVDRTEVTVGAYSACVARGKCTAAGAYHVTCTAHGHADDFPINCVDWNQATRFCEARDARLPTEPEWEYAASGGDDRLYSWGSQPPDDRTCWKSNGACPVKKFPAGEFGLFDMTGNLWEWTRDTYGDYPFPPLDTPDRTSKVYRGGSWSRRFEKWMRVRLRNRGAPSFEGAHLGFRCAQTASGAECPFGTDAKDGTCIHGVLEADCRPGKTWNGERCAPNEPLGPGGALNGVSGEPRVAKGCGEGHHFVPGHGCQFDVAAPEPDAPPLDLTAVRQIRSPEQDTDCATFQAARPEAYRFEGGSHEARNAVERGLGCKNRDVGVGWNSGCCP
jgi:formylglycine-generating enzyme required for sulfatase activity